VKPREETAPSPETGQCLEAVHRAAHVEGTMAQETTAGTVVREATVREGLLAQRWWTFVLRGIAAIAFGVLTFIWPGVSILSLVLLFGAYAIVNGAFNLALAARGPAGEDRWGSMVFEGAASIVAGVLTIIWPGISALVLLFLIAAWAIVTGVAQVVSAIRLRKHIRNEWLLGVMGVLSVVFGVLLMIFPGAGALAVVIWIGAYAVVIGALMIALGIKLRQRSVPARRVPTGGIPARA
jgi:uncharacterized membrane protein HdeD (DUF308 family)